MVKQSTRMVCPIKVETFSIFGYFQILISLKEYPWVLTNSLIVLPNIKLHTCEPVSTERRVQPVSVFLKRMFLSAVPPPEAKSPCWCGDHATAFTAAMWSANLSTGELDLAFQIINLLSFPPEHSCCSSGDHFKPQTSCLCPVSLVTKAGPHRTSLCRMVLSLDPVERMEELHEIEPTRLECPCMTLTRFTLLTSHKCTSPLLVPKQNEGPFAAHPTEVTVSDSPKSQSLVTLELSPFQRQTFEARPTARKFCWDQSIKLRQKSSCKAGASNTLNGILPIFLLALIEVTNSSVKSKAVLSSKGSLRVSTCSCWPNLNKLLFWNNSMGLSDLMLRLGSLIMHFLQMSESDSEQGSAGEGGLFQLETFSSRSLAMSYGFNCLRVGMKRSVTMLLSLLQSYPRASGWLSQQSTMISRSLDSVFELLRAFLEERAFPRGDSGLFGQKRVGEQVRRCVMVGDVSNRNYNAVMAIWIQKRIDNKINIIPLEPKTKQNSIGIIYNRGKIRVLLIQI